MTKFLLVNPMQKKQKTRLRAEEDNRLEQRRRVQEIEGEQIEREMQERMRRAALRPIGVHVLTVGIIEIKLNQSGHHQMMRKQRIV